MRVTTTAAESCDNLSHVYHAHPIATCTWSSITCGADTGLQAVRMNGTTANSWQVFSWIPPSGSMPVEPLSRSRPLPVSGSGTGDAGCFGPKVSLHGTEPGPSIIIRSEPKPHSPHWRRNTRTRPARYQDKLHSFHHKRAAMSTHAFISPGWRA